MTKSQFVLGMECPTKLFYAARREYPNRNGDNEFLKSLAEGGFQVGALARCLFPGGHLVESLDRAEALAETNRLLARPEVTVFEAAISTGTLFLRADVLVKKGNQLTLYEVKAKSWGPDDSVVNKKGTGVLSGWMPYLFDVAYQTEVLRRAFPGFTVFPHLLLADKSARASVDGLNQKFRLVPGEGGKKGHVELVGDVSPEALGTPLLVDVPVDEVVDGMLAGSLFDADGKSLAGWIDALDAAVNDGQRRPARLSKACKICEFRATPEEQAAGRPSGFHQCWSTEGGLTAEELSQPLVLELWNSRATDRFLAEDKLLLEDLTDEDFPRRDDPEGAEGLGAGARQYLQYRKVVTGDPTPYLDRMGLRAALAGVRYPLHFIDFETSMVAVPFHRGRRPYEQHAFQFSHHQMAADGTYGHQDQFLSATPGVFPNFAFVRALRDALGKDEGTVFRFSHHENSVLRQIADQLEVSQEPDREDLVRFCEALTYDTTTGRVGPRTMVDLCEWVKKFYYHPAMKGSNSIKVVFPALLNSSAYLKARYASPIYGGSIPSLNFGPTSMVQVDPATGLVLSPYKTLPPVLEGLAAEDEAGFYRDEETIKDGGAAMTAFARLQFSEVTEAERRQIVSALYRYCEIDTLAMVMIWEAWREMLG